MVTKLQIRSITPYATYPPKRTWIANNGQDCINPLRRERGGRAVSLQWLRRKGSTVRDSLDVDLAKTAAAVMVARITAAGAQFALTLVIARALGAEISGFYYLAFSVATVGSVVASLGIGTATLRFIATAASENDWPRVAGVHRQGALVTGIASVAIAGIVFALAPWLADAAFGKPDAGASFGPVSRGTLFERDL